MILTNSPMMCGLLINVNLCLEIECLMLLFVQSIRSGKFEMFVGVLDQFATWLFALDHTNYAWWLPVFIRSLKTLPHQYSNVYEQLLKGQFTTQKGIRKFPRIPDYHAHEQNNKIVKGTGGAVGIFDSPIAWAKWMIAGWSQNCSDGWELWGLLQ